MKKRYLWIEDFNYGRAEQDLKTSLLSQTQLSEDVVTFAGNFTSALKEINEPDCLYDTVLIDIDFPANEKMPPELEGYITPEKYQFYVQRNEESAKNKAGYPLFLYLLMAKRFPSSRICFMSANIFEGDNQFKEVDEIRKCGDLSIFRTRKVIRNQYENLQDTIEEIGEKIGITESVPDCPEEYFSDREKLVQHLIENVLPMIDAIEAREERKEFIGNFKDFLEEFDKIGIIRPLYFEKDVMRKKLLDFITQDNAYYQLRYCIINICDNIIRQIETKHTEVIGAKFVHTEKNKETGEEETKYNKYTEEDFKHLLENIKSRFHHFKPDASREQQIYFNIISDVVSFMEILPSPEKNDAANYSTLKFLRNMIAHGKIKEASLEFCAFIFGTGIRFLFNINNKEYQKLEDSLLDCIGTEQKNAPVIDIRDKLNTLLNEAYEHNKSEFLIDDNIYRIFQIIGSKKSEMDTIALQHCYQLYVLKFYTIKKLEIQIKPNNTIDNEITTYINLKIKSTPTNPDKYFKRIINLI